VLAVPRTWSPGPFRTFGLSAVMVAMLVIVMRDMSMRLGMVVVMMIVWSEAKSGNLDRD
jgi:hypothetical protein